MKAVSLKKHEGQVVVLDLVMGKEITTRIKSVNVDDGTVVCSKARIFLPVPNPNNPADITVMPLEYGHPLYQADDEMEIEAAHVFTVFTPTEDHKASYARITSGLVTANSNMLDDLPTVDGLQGFS